jgi:hypothetical protein
MVLQSTLERFGELLNVRLSKAIFTTEDSIRFTFFAALLEKGGVQSEDIILEYRHPGIAGAEIDTWIPGFGGVGVAVEFKYDRGIPSGKTTPRTQKAGKVFHDLFRLGQIASGMRRLFVYATGPEMASYFANPANGLREFFDLATGRTLRIDREFISGKSATFVSAVGETPDVEVTSLFERSLPNPHEMRIYEIHRLDRSC